MKIRVLSGLVGLPISLTLVYFGGFYLQLALLVISLIGMSEFYKSLSKQHLNIHYIGYLFAVFYYYLININFYVVFLFSVVAQLLILLICLVILNKKINIVDIMVTFFGFIYIAVLMSFVYLTREISDYGIYFVWLIFICAWGCDTSAYFTGLTLGKHKLAENLSPKKTIEGSVGGIIGSMLITLIGYSLILNNDSTEFGLLLYMTVVSFFGAILSQFGDLSASSIKRYAKIKDYSELIPGHGGILDRFDSILFTAPTVYIAFLILDMM